MKSATSLRGIARVVTSTLPGYFTTAVTAIGTAFGKIEGAVGGVFLFALFVLTRPSPAPSHG